MTSELDGARRPIQPFADFFIHQRRNRVAHPRMIDIQPAALGSR
jgi:hypothetical protein